MRFAFALALLLLPVTAFAQLAEGPDVMIPVQKCVPTRSGAACTPVRDGSDFSAANGYVRVSRDDAAQPSRRASASQAPEGPFMTR